jgi:hypothetical protein
MLSVDAPPVLWIGEHSPAHDRPLPPDSRTWTLEEATAREAEPDWPPDLTLLRQRGMFVDCSASADRETRRIARRLRLRFAPRRPSQLATIADELCAPELAAVLRSWADDEPITFARLASELGDRRLGETTRILLALEHL